MVGSPTAPSSTSSMETSLRDSSMPRSTTTFPLLRCCSVISMHSLASFLSSAVPMISTRPPSSPRGSISRRAPEKLALLNFNQTLAVFANQIFNRIGFRQSGCRSDTGKHMQAKNKCSLAVFANRIEWTQAFAP
jgi:hypothetical protein